MTQTFVGSSSLPTAQVHSNMIIYSRGFFDSRHFVQRGIGSEVMQSTIKDSTSCNDSDSFRALEVPSQKRFRFSTDRLFYCQVVLHIENVDSMSLIPWGW
jgi:hypothetical protein